jgi:hypothetical protein
MSGEGRGGIGVPGADRIGGQCDRPGGEHVWALAKLLEADGLPDLDELTGPTHWPNLSANEAAGEWGALCTWVEHLMARFSHLDHHVIPRCWFRHNGHVEALSALRDQERVNYGETAPGTAAVDWHRAFREIEARLREWTAQLACGATHEPRSRQAQPTTSGEWDGFVEEDVASRNARAIDDALSGTGTAYGPLLEISGTGRGQVGHGRKT